LEQIDHLAAKNIEHHMLLMKPFLIEPNAVADELGNRRGIKGHHQHILAAKTAQKPSICGYPDDLPSSFKQLIVGVCGWLIWISLIERISLFATVQPLLLQSNSEVAIGRLWF
jgi:hypothetical protein